MQNNLSVVTDTYLQSILDDYIEFIKNLDLLVRSWQNEEEFARDWDDISKLKDIHAKIQFSRYCEKLKKDYLSNSLILKYMTTISSPRLSTTIRFMSKSIGVMRARGKKAFLTLKYR